MGRRAIWSDCGPSWWRRVKPGTDEELGCWHYSEDGNRAACGYGLSPFSKVVTGEIGRVLFPACGRCRATKLAGTRRRRAEGALVGDRERTLS